MSVDELVEEMFKKLASTTVVKPGDTIGHLAEQAGITVQEMLEVNPGVVPERLKPGQILNVPKKTKQPSQVGNFDIDTEISRAATKYGVDSRVLKALVFLESSNNPKADNGQAQGLTQLTPAIQKMVGVSNPFDPVQSIHGGAMWLSIAEKEAAELNGVRGNLSHALMIYHAGKPAVQEWISAGSPAGGHGQVGQLTIGYAQKILHAANKANTAV